MHESIIFRILGCWFFRERTIINPFKLKNMILVNPTLSEVKEMMAVQNTPSSYVYEGYTEEEVWDDEDLGDF